MRNMHDTTYDGMLTSMYLRESKEELVQRVMALGEIESKDRHFANQCEAGTTIANINELFSAIDDLKSGFSYEKAMAIFDIAELARGSWNFITNGLADMNDDFRCTNQLDDLKKRIGTKDI